MRTSTLTTTLALGCIATIAGLAVAAGVPEASDPSDEVARDFFSRNVAAFSPSTGTPCAELTAEFRQAEAKLARSALAVAAAIEDRDRRALERACRHGATSIAATRDVLEQLERRCPDHAGVVRTGFADLPGEYAPAAVLLARCD